MIKPNVTIICPCTGERISMFDRMVRMLAKQDYGLSNIEFLSDINPGTIGFKRNKLCRWSKSDIILHMDSDDYYAPDWVTRSVQALISSKAQLVGLSTAYFLNTRTREVHDLQPNPNNQLYICGATMCYYKSFWERKPFEDISAGEDFNFQFNNGLTACHGYKEGFLATIHGGNTVSHHSLPLIKKVAPHEAELLISNFESNFGVSLR